MRTWKTVAGGFAAFLVVLAYAVHAMQPEPELPKIPLPEMPKELLAPRVPELPKAPMREESPGKPEVGTAGFVEAFAEPSPAPQILHMPKPAPIQPVLEPAPQPMPRVSAPLPMPRVPVEAPVQPATQVKDQPKQPVEPKVFETPQPIPAPQRVFEPALLPGAASPSSNNIRGLSVGLGLYYVRPHWDNNFAFTRTAQVNPQNLGDPTLQSIVTRDFDFATTSSPRIVLGYEDPCTGFGVSIGWWHFDQSSEIRFGVPFVTGGFITVTGAGNAPGTTSTFSGVNGFGLNDGERDNLVFRNRLVMDVWDLDVSQRFGNDCWNLIVGAGVRYAFIAQYYDAISSRSGQQFPNIAGGLINSREVHARNVINGVGLDLFLDGTKSVGTFGLAVYGNLRGGYLIGPGKYTQQSRSTIVPPIPGFLPIRSDEIDRNRAGIPFLEAELGLEWHGQGSARIQPFLRVGVVSHTWFGLGSALSSSGNTNTLGNFGFFGGTLMGGVSF